MAGWSRAAPAAITGQSGHQATRVRSARSFIRPAPARPARFPGLGACPGGAPSPGNGAASAISPSGLGSQSEAVWRRPAARRPSTATWTSRERRWPAPGADGATPRQSGSERVKVRSGASGHAPDRPGSCTRTPPRSRTRATSRRASPGRTWCWWRTSTTSKASATAATTVPHCAAGRGVHHHHPLEVDAQLGRRQQPHLGGADPDDPRPGGRRPGHQPEGERRRARALDGHHRTPLEAATRRQPGQRRGERQQVLTGQRGRADPPAEDLQLAHLPSIEHLFDAGKRTSGGFGDAFLRRLLSRRLGRSSPSPSAPPPRPARGSRGRGPR